MNVVTYAKIWFIITFNFFGTVIVGNVSNIGIGSSSSGSSFSGVTCIATS